MEEAQDPQNSCFETEILQKRLHVTQKKIPDERFQDMILQDLTDEYDNIRDTHYRDRAFGLEEMKTTMKNIYADNLSRRGNNSRIGRRGVALGVQDLNDTECY